MGAKGGEDRVDRDRGTRVVQGLLDLPAKHGVLRGLLAIKGLETGAHDVAHRVVGAGPDPSLDPVLPIAEGEGDRSVAGIFAFLP